MDDQLWGSVVSPGFGFICILFACMGHSTDDVQLPILGVEQGSKIAIMYSFLV